MWFEHPAQFNTLGKKNQDEDRNRPHEQLMMLTHRTAEVVEASPEEPEAT